MAQFYGNMVKLKTALQNKKESYLDKATQMQSSKLTIMDFNHLYENKVHTPLLVLLAATQI